MLHAELHNKFDIETLDFERSEDILTSTVFGTLLVADGGQTVLREWLRQAQFDGGSPDLHLPDGAADYRFWPTLGGCTPDLALRFGELVCVLEVKYRSGASDIHREGADEPELQLAKQWEACRDGRRLMQAFGNVHRFRDAVVLYVVDGSRGIKSARRALEKATKHPGCAGGRLGILFWQQLYMSLRRKVEAQTECPRWIGDLAMLLERRHLGSFTGFPKRFDPADAAGAQDILRWRRRSRSFRAAFQSLDAYDLERFTKQLQRWRRHA